MIIKESIILCLLFTLMVYIMSRKPIKTLYNYPKAIQDRVKSLAEYQDQIPTKQDKLSTKIIASILFTVILSLLLRYVNGYTTFKDAFKYGFILWSIVNLYDLIVMDIIWFCHDPYFVFEGTEDMVKDYHDYWFHFKGFIIGEVIALFVCAISGIIVEFIL